MVIRLCGNEGNCGVRQNVAWGILSKRAVVFLNPLLIEIVLCR